MLGLDDSFNKALQHTKLSINLCNSNIFLYLIHHYYIDIYADCYLEQILFYGPHIYSLSAINIPSDISIKIDHLWKLSIVLHVTVYEPLTDYLLNGVIMRASVIELKRICCRRQIDSVKFYISKKKKSVSLYTWIGFSDTSGGMREKF